MESASLQCWSPGIGRALLPHPQVGPAGGGKSTVLSALQRALTALHEGGHPCERYQVRSAPHQHSGGPPLARGAHITQGYGMRELWGCKSATLRTWAGRARECAQPQVRHTRGAVRAVQRADRRVEGRPGELLARGCRRPVVGVSSCGAAAGSTRLLPAVGTGQAASGALLEQTHEWGDTA